MIRRKKKNTSFSQFRLAGSTVCPHQKPNLQIPNEYLNLRLWHVSSLITLTWSWRNGCHMIYITKKPPIEENLEHLIPNHLIVPKYVPSLMQIVADTKIFTYANSCALSLPNVNASAGSWPLTFRSRFWVSLSIRQWHFFWIRCWAQMCQHACTRLIISRPKLCRQASNTNTAMVLIQESNTDLLCRDAGVQMH